MRKLLSEISRKECSKEELVLSLWGQAYHSLRHDPMVYNLISKTRKVLGPWQHWISATEHGYAIDAKIFEHHLKRVDTNILEERVRQNPELADLNFRQLQMLNMLKAGHVIDLRICVESLKASEATINRDLTALVNRNLARRIGKGRATKYSAF
jgi:Fic family protein